MDLVLAGVVVASVLLVCLTVILCVAIMKFGEDSKKRYDERNHD